MEARDKKKQQPLSLEVPRWERNARLLPAFRNRAGQAYSLDADGGGRVTNYGEVLGRGFYFKAEGVFAAAGGAAPPPRCPADF